MHARACAFMYVLHELIAYLEINLTVKSYFDESVTSRKKNVSCSKFKRTKELPHVDNNNATFNVA